MEGRMPDLVFEAAIMSVYDRTSETGRQRSRVALLDRRSR